jgi:hypothetical protein
MEKSATVGQIWDASKTYTSSNTVKRYDAIIDAKSVQELGTYARTHLLETVGVSMDEKADDRLQKYTIKKITPTRRLEEIENPTEMYLITDEFGHDIGTYMMTEHGPEFKLSPKIAEANEKIISQFPEESREMLEARYKIDTLEDLYEKLSKGEDIALASKEQAQGDIQKVYENAGLSESAGDKNEDEEEKAALAKIPSDMKSEVLEECRKRNIKIKELLIIDCPECVSRELGEGENHIRENGGPIIMVQAKNDGFDSADKAYMFQDGQELPDVEKNKDRILELMEQHKDEGVIPDLLDNREEEIKKQLDESVMKYQKTVEEYEKMNFESPEDKEKAIANARNTLLGDTQSIIGDYTPDSNGEIASYVKAIKSEVEPEKENKKAVDGRAEKVEEDAGRMERTIYDNDPLKKHNN